MKTVELKDLIAGTKFWSCRQPQETEISNEGYQDFSPHHPWQGILSIQQRPGGTTYLLHRFGEEDVIDRDTNATAIISRPWKDLFLTEKEAIVHYKQACFKHACRLMDDAKEFFKEAAL